MAKIKEILDRFGVPPSQRTSAMRSYARELRSLQSLLEAMKPRYPSAIAAYAWIERRIVDLERRLTAGHVPTVEPVTP